MSEVSPVDAMFEADVRIETLIYLPGIVADQPEAFTEGFCENLPERKDAPLWSQLPTLAQFSDGEEWPDPEDVAQALSFTKGFLVQAATPVKEHSASGACIYSWGYYHTEWLYAATEADIARVCVEWAEASDAEDKAKSLKGEAA